jgi:hypothetical protein
MTQAPFKSSLTNIQKRRIDAGTSIRSERAERIDFLHSVQCQCSLP